ncbi:glycosyltransferase family A protein [Demequina sp. SYSU T00192]|uniref:Glycosyltransferase family A protein n=1 Tax=Demequina litoralis TaxID=3051660 RepID=A0ABT8G7Y6_9MICO|nr:glycosyltransferase family A protein [Demequina sp. SYSU T00192]MDN4475167.1 glycosyltransferase family A protein [Demequina sp. SYSU T00192]
MPFDRSVSVIIPVHNGADFIGTALQSLERQVSDPARMQVVIIDDGSTDRTGDIAREFGDRLGEMVILRNESPQSVGTARVQGLKAADREYIAFLDADDWMAPGRLDHLMARCDELGVDFVRTDHVRAFETGQPREIHRAPEGRRDVPIAARDAILPTNHASLVDYPFPWAGIFHRRLVDDGRLAYDEGLHSFEDRVAIWRLALSDATVAVVDAPWIVYRRDVGTSLTQVFDRRQLAFIDGFALVRDLVMARDEDRVFEAKVIRQFLAIAAHHVARDRGMSHADRRLLRASIREFATTLDREPLAKEWEAIGMARRSQLGPAILPVLKEKASA